MSIRNISTGAILPPPLAKNLFTTTLNFVGAFQTSAYASFSILGNICIMNITNVYGIPINEGPLIAPLPNGYFPQSIMGCMIYLKTSGTGSSWGQLTVDNTTNNVLIDCYGGFDITSGTMQGFQTTVVLAYILSSSQTTSLGIFPQTLKLDTPQQLITNEIITKAIPIKSTNKLPKPLTPMGKHTKSAPSKPSLIKIS